MHSSPAVACSTDSVPESVVQETETRFGFVKERKIGSLRNFRVFRRFLIGMIILMMMPLSFSFAENLLVNADFQELDEEGYPDFWYTDAYVMEPGFTVFSVTDNQDSNAIEIRNIGSNDARFAQAVEVEPDTLYCLSGDILADGIKDGHGANLSIEGIYAFSEQLYDTGGEWKHIEYYGETGPEQDFITVFARLGGYSGESTGRACFKNLSLKKADSVPGEQIADLWYRKTESHESFEETEEEDEAAGPAWPWLIFIAAIYAAAAAAYIQYLKNNQRTSDLHEDKKKASFEAGLILCLSLAFRVILSANITGYMVDVNCFLSWGHTFAAAGPAGFYEATSFCDYPPLYTYILGLNSLVSGALGSGEAITRIIFRLVPSICDLAGCWLIYRILLNSGRIRKSEALAALMLLAFHPAMILNSAAWGQMDGVLCLLLMCVALLAVEGKWIPALPLYVVSVLIKPQALMLGPLGLAYIFKAFAGKKESRRAILIGTAASFAVLAAGVIPFSIRQNWDWLIQLYAKTLGSYPYATVNTANFHYLLGGNWVKVETAAHPAVPIIFAVLCTIYGIWWLHRARKLRLKLIESILSFVFATAFISFAIIGASWSVTGAAAMTFAFVIILSQAIRSRKAEMLTYLGALLYILLYVFGVKMHERYLFPAILLLASAWVLLRDRRIFTVFIVFTTTLFINEGIVLDNSIRLGSSMGHLNRDTIWLADIISVINILGSIYAVYLSIELMLENEPRTPGLIMQLFPAVHIRKTARDPRDWKPDRSLHWTRKDTIILSVITIVFSTVSLLTLGSTKAPQREWIASSDEEAVIFDLGKEQDHFSVLYFAQVSRNDFSFAVSNDGVNWSEEYWAQMDQGQCWKWKYLTESYPGTTSGRTYYNSDLDHVIYLDGRYVRLTAQSLGLTLNEIIFRDSHGNNIPAVITGRTGAIAESELYSDPERLIDEQDTLEKLPQYFRDEASENAPAQPGWWNSTYFDEIYHARTAFEFLKGSVPYETSHPPLGKVLMSAFVALFGMTPFGWRFAGALAGILMLPGMYLLGKQLTKKTWIAAFACLCMALDCMHLTQTQIATIDSFPVLFIIFAYFFMLRFLQTDILQQKIARILPDLAASGVFIGLSIASKWIGIYAGGGLAILFFWHCFRTYRLRREGELAVQREDLTDEEKASLETWLTERPDRKAATRRILVLCAWCVLFFAVIPIIIYLLSYIPYMAYNSRRIRSIGDYINEVWKSQIGMFSYHSTKNLGMDHPFYSPWWEWPVIGKPMYYAAEQYLPKDSGLHHSIFCFGNPVIWFSGLAALLYCAVRAIGNRRYKIPGQAGIWHLKAAVYDPRYMFILTGILAQYLPWVMVPRGTYIYHYFASLPFLMLALSICFDRNKERNEQRKAFLIGIVFIILSAVAFIVFFPYASGISAPGSWLDIGRRILRIWY